MALNIKDERTDRLARELAEVTGESITVAVRTAVEHRLEGVSGSVPSESRVKEMNRIASEASSLPLLDERSEDEILGLAADGIPSTNGR